MFKIRCPQCNAKIRIPDHRVGKTAKCPRCSGPIECVPPGIEPRRPESPLPEEPRRHAQPAPPVAAAPAEAKPIARAPAIDAVTVANAPDNPREKSPSDMARSALATCLDLGQRAVASPVAQASFSAARNAAHRTAAAAVAGSTQAFRWLSRQSLKTRLICCIAPPLLLIGIYVGNGLFSTDQTPPSARQAITMFKDGAYEPQIAPESSARTPKPSAPWPSGDQLQPPQPPSLDQPEQPLQPDAVEPVVSPQEYGPLLKGDEYLILSEWSFGRDARKGYPAIISFLEDGRAVFNRKKLESQGSPILGKYRFLGDGRIEFTAEFFRGGSWRPKYEFSYERLMLTDSDGGPMMFMRHPGARLSLADRHPEIQHKVGGRLTNAEITLTDGLRTGLLEMRVSVRRKTAGDERLEVTIAKADQAFPGRLSIIVEPGTPLFFGGRKGPGSEEIQAPIILISLKQTSKFTTGELNRVIIDENDNRSPSRGTRCLMTWYPFHASRTIPSTMDGSAPLRFDDHMHRLKISGLGPALFRQPLDQHDPLLTKAGHVLGAVWNESSLKQLQAKYTNLPTTKTDWPDVVRFVEQALEIRPGNNSPSDLIGLWTGNPKMLEKLSSAEILKLKPAVAQVWTGLMPQSRLLLQRDNRFTLIVPDQDASDKKKQIGKGVIRFQGSWKHVGRTVICTPQYDRFESNISTGRWPRIVQENKRFSLLIRGDELIFASTQGGLSAIALTRHAWFDGNAPSEPPRPPRPTTIATGGEKPGKSPIANARPSGKPGLVRIAMTGDPVPGSDPGDTLLDVSVPVLNAAGDVAFVGIVANHGSSIWRTHAGSLEPILIGKVDAPNIAPKAHVGVGFGGAADSEQWGRSIHLSDAGDVFMRARLRGLENPRHGNHAIVRWDGRQFTAATYEGMQLPGVDEAEYRHDERSDYLVTPDGYVSFPGSLRTRDRKETLGLWSGKPGRMQAVAMAGQPAPGANGRFINSGFGRYQPLKQGAKRSVVWVARSIETACQARRPLARHGAERNHGIRICCHHQQSGRCPAAHRNQRWSIIGVEKHDDGVLVVVRRRIPPCLSKRNEATGISRQQSLRDSILADVQCSRGTGVRDPY